MERSSGGETALHQVQDRHHAWIHKQTPVTANRCAQVQDNSQDQITLQINVQKGAIYRNYQQ